MNCISYNPQDILNSNKRFPDFGEIYDIAYISDEIILILYKKENNVKIIEFNIINNTIINSYNSTYNDELSSESFLKINDEKKYVIILPYLSNEGKVLVKNQKFHSKENRRKKRIIIIWFFDQNKSFYFESNYFNNIKNISIYKNKISIYSDDSPPFSTVYIYDFENIDTQIIKYQNVINNLLENNIPQRSKKITIKSVHSLLNVLFFNSEFIIVYDTTNYYLYQYISDGYQFRIKFFNSEYNSIPLIYDNCIYILIFGHNIILRVFNDISNLREFSDEIIHNMIADISYNRDDHKIYMTSNNVIVLFNIKNNKLFLIKYNYNYYTENIDFLNQITSINIQNNNILICSNYKNLIQFKPNSYLYFPIVHIGLFNDNNILKKYIESILSNFNNFKKYIIDNRLLEIGINDKHYELLNQFEIFNKLKIFLSYIKNYIISIPSNNSYNEVDFKIKEIYTKFIYNYLNYLNKFYQDKCTSIWISEPSIRININPGDELISIKNVLIRNEKITKITIKYNDNPAINAGGVSRAFYTNLEKILNMKFKLENNIQKLQKETKKLNNTILSTAKRMGKVNNENYIRSKKNSLKNNYNIINISIINKQIELNSIIAKNIENDIDDKIIFDILALSKINNNSIYYNSNLLKNILLKEILKLNKKDDIKNILYNILIVNNDKIIDETYLNDININIENNSDLLNDINSKNIKILDYIKKYIREGYYINLLDVYVSHFIPFKINVVSLIDRTEFNTYGLNSTLTRDFIRNFKKCLMELSDEELVYYNMSISGSRLEQSYYRVSLKPYTKPPQLTTQNEIKLNKIKKLEPQFATCSNLMTIDNIEGFSKIYMEFNEDGVWDFNSKKRFIDLFEKYSKFFTKA